MSASMLTVSGVQHSFRGLSVLKGVRFDVPRGALVGLIGPNGAGKSTLFNIVSGFLKPSAGSVSFDGADVSTCSVQERSRRGLVRTFQTPQVFGAMSVLENLMVGLHKHTRGGVLANLLRTPGSRAEHAQTRQRAEQVLERFGLQRVRDQAAASLPGGLQRMLELARAYLGRPRLLMLDEPSSGLNSEEIEQLRRTLSELNAEGISILLVSHDMELASMASVIHVLCFGEIIASGPMQAMREDARVREAYLGA
jgi:ABC-type branched-subunit amino acid transport system ATPase component